MLHGQLREFGLPLTRSISDTKSRSFQSHPVGSAGREYDIRRKVVYEGLNEIEGITCMLPEATFYAFPNISKLGMTSWDFAKYLVKEYKVATVPGSIFGNQGEGFLRISFALDVAKLKEGVSRIKKGAGSLRPKKLIASSRLDELYGG